MMATLASLLLAAAATLVAAKHDPSTFAVLRFNNAPGRFATEGRMDPIVSPGAASGHSHGVMGGSNFGLDVRGPQLLSSACTSANVAVDKSNYWVPDLWFRSPVNGTFKKVPLYYMNVYYFFDKTHDDIKAFPAGLKIVSGDATRRTPPATGTYQLDPAKGPIQPVQWMCASATDQPNYPAGSDGTRGGLPDPVNAGTGAGFPVIQCDALYTPLRQDVHLPSCYDPSAGPDAHERNTAFPSDGGDGHLDCPPGWTHVPHLFFEVYYDTSAFARDWEPDGHRQPFVLSNGDATGYGSHADFIAGWDEAVLQAVIDSCDAGQAGLDRCPQLAGRTNADTCQFPSRFPNPAPDRWLDKLPGDNPVSGWGL